MKIKTALKQSKVAVKIDAVLIVIALCLVLKWPNLYSIAFLVITAFYLVMEAINIVHIRHKAAKDRNFLDEKIK